MLIFVLPLLQKIGYDNAAAVAKKAHKEGSTLKVNDSFCSIIHLMCLAHDL